MKSSDFDQILGMISKGDEMNRWDILYLQTIEKEDFAILTNEPEIASLQPSVRGE